MTSSLTEIGSVLTPVSNAIDEKVPEITTLGHPLPLDNVQAQSSRIPDTSGAGEGPAELATISHTLLRDSKTTVQAQLPAIQQDGTTIVERDVSEMGISEAPWNSAGQGGSVQKSVPPTSSLIASSGDAPHTTNSLRLQIQKIREEQERLEIIERLTKQQEELERELEARLVLDNS